MLQQTRVETVLPYYRRWLERFPSLKSLARAREEEVLMAWQGLGYYSRARRLLGAARLVQERYQGELPTSARELRGLPGVGEYTAGAVASMAFGEVVPAVDGNVKRVLARLFDLPSPAAAELRDLAARLVDPERPGDFNQAMMDFGSTTCVPRVPRCRSCPLQGMCLARARGTVRERPGKKKRRELPEVEVAVVVAVRAPEPRFLLRRRPGEGLLAGMWEFPGKEVVPGGSAREVALKLAVELELAVTGEPVELEVVRHVFSHLKARYRPFLLAVQSVGESQGGRWLREEDLPEVPLAAAQTRIAEAVRKVVQYLGSGL